MEKKHLNIKYLFDMCTHQRYVLNPYIHKRILVPCGHCEACVQQKAVLRTNKIRNQYDEKKVFLFGHLTYSRFACPFVYLEDIRHSTDGSRLPIYRDSRFVTRRVGQSYHFKTYQIQGLQKLSEIEVLDSYGRDYYFKTLAKNRGKVGITYFKDYQDFSKRFRMVLKRNYGVTEHISLYCCSEYGETTHRPHFHFLAQCSPQNVQKVKSAIVKAWPFGDRARTWQNIEVARDAAGYVASYVNCGTAFPQFLKKNARPKHSHSKYFGQNKDSFSLASILQKIPTRDLRYTSLTVKNGCSVAVDLPLPKYVVNRFFPLFKGYSRLTGFEICNYIYRIKDLIRDSRYEYDNKKFERLKSIGYTDDDFHRIGTMLHHAFMEYNRLTGRSRFQYAQDFYNAWKAYKMTHLRNFYENKDDLPWIYKYENIAAYHLGKLKAPTLDNFPRFIEPIFDYNKLPDVVNKTTSLTRSYYSYLKTKSVNNRVLSSMHDDV